MSYQFWVNLLISFCVLSIAIIYINRSKIRFIRTLMAGRLRQKILPRMKAVLTILMHELQTEDYDKFLLYKLKADLENDVLKASVLYDIERVTLVDFLTKLSTYIIRYETEPTADNQVEDLILVGQRVIAEISELK